MLSFLSKTLTKEGRPVALLAFCVVVVTLALFAFYPNGQTTRFVPLSVDVKAEDQASLMRTFLEKKISFSYDSPSGTLSVQKSQIELAKSVVSDVKNSKNSIVGYEVFDSHSIVTSAAVQRINQKRAKEGELTRTINSIRGVKGSRVHLAIPERSLFVEDQKKTTASVVLDLDGDSSFTQNQVFGIAQLLSNAIEGLNSRDIAIVDSNGKVLWGAESQALPDTGLATTRLESRTESNSTQDTVSPVPQRPTRTAVQRSESSTYYWRDLQVFAGVGLLLFALGVFLFLNFLKRKDRRSWNKTVDGGSRSTAEQMALHRIRGELARQVQSNPKATAEALEKWLDENPMNLSKNPPRIEDGFQNELR